VRNNYKKENKMAQEIKKQTITLEISYDEGFAEPPAQWDWPALLGIGVGDERVQILEVDGVKVPLNEGN
jgi:hypothetical protein